MNAEWLRCKPWIEAALDRGPGLETIEDVERMIDEGVYHLRPFENSAVLLRVDEYPRARVLTVVHGGGDLTEFYDVIEPMLREFAKANRCTGLMITGRDGWKRAAQKRGYRTGWTTMILDIEQESVH